MRNFFGFTVRILVLKPMSDARIAALERQVGNLQVDLAIILKGVRATVAPRAEQVGVVITTPPLPRLLLPTDSEYDRLLAIVIAKYPQLGYPKDVDPVDFRAQFCAAFLFAAHHGRRTTLDRERDLNWWNDNCVHWCREHRVPPSWMTGAALAAGVVAQGDVLFAPLDRFPLEQRFGLQFGGGGSRAGDWWRRALAGTLLEPAESPFPRPAQNRSAVQQRGGQ
jgi:hypothetical protein